MENNVTNIYVLSSILKLCRSLAEFALNYAEISPNSAWLGDGPAFAAGKTGHPQAESYVHPTLFSVG